MCGDGRLARGEFLVRASWRPWCAACTRAVTFSMEIRTLTSRSGDFISSLRRGRVEAVPDVIVLGGGVLLQLAARDVVVRQQQAVRADERTRAAVVQAHAREAHVVQPLLGGSEIVLLLELLEGWIVECPHALVGESGRSKKGHCQQRRSELAQDETMFHGLILFSIGVGPREHPGQRPPAVYTKLACGRFRSSVSANRESRPTGNYWPSRWELRNADGNRPEREVPVQLPPSAAMSVGWLQGSGDKTHGQNSPDSLRFRRK